jgi:hypothetical protein
MEVPDNKLDRSKGSSRASWHLEGEARVAFVEADPRKRERIHR